MLLTLVRWSNIRHLSHQRLRSALALIGVVIGVSIFVFAPTLALSIQRTNSNVVEDIAGKAELEVRGGISGFSFDLLPTIRGTEGVSIAAPISNSGGVLSGEPELLIFLGIDPAIDREVRSYTLQSGEFLSGENAVLLTARYADEKGLAIGDQITLVGVGGSREMTIVGILENTAGVARLNSGDIAVMPLPDALALRGIGNVDAVAIVPARRNDLDDLTQNLRTALPETVTVDTPVSRNRDADRMQVVTNSLIFTISLMCLILGSMLIYNTMAVSVAQRRLEIGILRALGTPRQTIIRQYLLEAGVLGVIGSILGVIVGIALVEISSRMSLAPPTNAASMNPVVEIAVPPLLPLIAFIFGVSVSLLAGYLPSRRAAHVDPIESLTQLAGESGRLEIRRRRVIIFGGTLLLTVAASTQIKPEVESMGLSTLVIWLAVLSGLAIYPAVLVGLGKVIPGIMQRVFGLPGMIAAGNLTRRPKRMVATGMLLMFGIWMYIVTSGANFGYADFMAQWSASENVWDLTVVGAGYDPFTPGISLPPQVIAEISARPDMEVAAAERYSRVTIGTVTYTIRALDTAAFYAGGASFMWNDKDPGTGHITIQDASRPAMLILGMEATKPEHQRGQTAILDTPSGEVEFAFAGWVMGLARDQNMLIMDRAVYQQFWGDDQVDRLLIKVAPGADVNAVRRDLLQTYGLSGVLVVDNSEVEAAFLNRMRSITGVSQMLSILLAMVFIGGIISTFFIVVLDRRREIGMLRALGMLRRQITTSVLLEGLLLVIIGAVIAVPGGMFTVAVNSRIIHEMLGIPYTHVRLIEALSTVLVVTLTVLLTVYFPARKAGRTNVLEAMRYE